MFFKKKNELLEELRELSKGLIAEIKQLSDQVANSPEKIIPVVVKDFENSLQVAEDYKSLDVYYKCVNNHMWGNKEIFDISPDVYIKFYEGDVFDKVYKKEGTMIAFFLGNKLICKIPEGK